MSDSNVFDELSNRLSQKKRTDSGIHTSLELSSEHELRGGASAAGDVDSGQDSDAGGLHQQQAATGGHLQQQPATGKNDASGTKKKGLLKTFKKLFGKKGKKQQESDVETKGENVAARNVKETRRENVAVKKKEEVVVPTKQLPLEKKKPDIENSLEKSGSIIRTSLRKLNRTKSKTEETPESSSKPQQKQQQKQQREKREKSASVKRTLSSSKKTPAPVPPPKVDLEDVAASPRIASDAAKDKIRVAPQNRRRPTRYRNSNRQPTTAALTDIHEEDPTSPQPIIEEAVEQSFVIDKPASISHGSRSSSVSSNKMPAFSLEEIRKSQQELPKSALRYSRESISSREGINKHDSSFESLNKRASSRESMSKGEIFGENTNKRQSSQESLNKPGSSFDNINKRNSFKREPEVLKHSDKNLVKTPPEDLPMVPPRKSSTNLPEEFPHPSPRISSESLNNRHSPRRSYSTNSREATTGPWVPRNLKPNRHSMRNQTSLSKSMGALNETSPINEEKRANSHHTLDDIERTLSVRERKALFSPPGEKTRTGVDENNERILNSNMFYKANTRQQVPVPEHEDMNVIKSRSKHNEASFQLSGSPRKSVESKPAESIIKQHSIDKSQSFHRDNNEKVKETNNSANVPLVEKKVLTSEIINNKSEIASNNWTPWNKPKPVEQTQEKPQPLNRLVNNKTSLTASSDVDLRNRVKSFSKPEKAPEKPVRPLSFDLRSTAVYSDSSPNKPPIDKPKPQTKPKPSPKPKRAHGNEKQNAVPEFKRISLRTTPKMKDFLAAAEEKDKQRAEETKPTEPAPPIKTAEVERVKSVRVTQNTINLKTVEKTSFLSADVNMTRSKSLSSAHVRKLTSSREEVGSSTNSSVPTWVRMARRKQPEDDDDMQVDEEQTNVKPPDFKTRFNRQSLPAANQTAYLNQFVT